MKRTPRGFAVYGSLTDARKQRVRVQRSSEIGSPKCWLFTHDAEGNDHHVHHMHGVVTASPYLTQGQARRLAEMLLAFADGAE